jgi:hypothetical protein
MNDQYNFLGSPENDTASFNDQLTKNPELQARFDALSAMAVESARQIGCVISKGDAALLPSIRIAVLLGSPLDERFETEMQMLPQVAAAKERLQMAEKLKSGDKDTKAQFDRMSPADKISFARKHGLTGSSKKELTQAEQDARFDMVLMLNPAERLTMARKMNLI